jgi:hypothetical protein
MTVLENVKYSSISMEQHVLKNVSNSLSIKIFSYLEASGGQSSNLYLNVVHFFNVCGRLRQLFFCIGV